MTRPDLEGPRMPGATPQPGFATATAGRLRSPFSPNLSIPRPRSFPVALHKWRPCAAGRSILLSYAVP